VNGQQVAAVNLASKALRNHYRMLDLDFIKKEKYKRLQKVADELLSLNPVDQKLFFFSTNELILHKPPERIIQAVSEWVRDRGFLFVYYFSLLEDADLNTVYQRFSEAKKGKVGSRAYPRLNSESRYLYVGSSRGFIRRVREHLGYGSKDTYAMQLAYWTQELNLNIQLFCMRFKTSINQEVVQAFEDAIWDFVKPMLGRKGAR